MTERRKVHSSDIFGKSVAAATKSRARWPPVSGDMDYVRAHAGSGRARLGAASLATDSA